MHIPKEQRRGGSLDWLYLVAIVVGVMFLALGVWLNASAGLTTMKRGQQLPLEVVVSMSIGLALFISGIGGGVRAVRARRSRNR